MSRRMLAALAAAACVLPSALAAQSRVRAEGTPESSPAPAAVPGDDRADVMAQLGVGVTVSGDGRDTLGLLVTSVVPDGPADEAGLDQGNRIAEINGVSLRLQAAEVGRKEAGDAVLRRFATTLRSARPGETIALRAYGGGRFRTVSVRNTRPASTAPVVDASAPAAGPVAASAPASAPASVPAALPAAAPSYAAPKSAVAALQVATDSAARGASGARAGSLAGVAASMAALRAELRRLEQGEESGELVDTISQIALDLGVLQRRLRDAEARQRGVGAASDPRVPKTLEGLRVTAVGPEMAAYFGAGSERGLLVTEVDSTWAPLRTGDVILRVDGAPADAETLAEALAPRKPRKVEILRRGLVATVAVPGQE